MYITMPTDIERWTFAAPLPSPYQSPLSVLAPLTASTWAMVAAAMTLTAVTMAAVAKKEAEVTGRDADGYDNLLDAAEKTLGTFLGENMLDKAHRLGPTR